MDAFCGSWKRISSKNYTEFLEEVGFEEELRDTLNVVKPVLTITKDGDTVMLKLKTSIKSSEISIKLGEEFDETTLDGKNCKSVLYLEGGQLVQVKKWDNNGCKIIHEVKDGQLIVTLTCKEVVAVCTYEKL